MEPRDAIKVLADATRKILANRNKHQLWVEAVNVLLNADAQRLSMLARVDSKDPKGKVVG